MRAARRNAIIEAKTGRPVPPPPTYIAPKHVLHKQRAKAQREADLRAHLGRRLTSFFKSVSRERAA